VASVDVVVVTYQSAGTIASCLSSVCAISDAEVVVVDNASSDGTLEEVSSFPVSVEALPANNGFAYANNVGAALGSAPFVLFLNPDATIDEESLGKLVAVLSSDERVALAAPRIVNLDGSLALSLRRFPRIRSTYAQALFLHRLFATSPWTDEVIRDQSAYAAPGSPEWVSGACMLVRRSSFEQVGGWDSDFFLYCEDIDLCRRLRAAGLDIRFVPDSIVVHEGGASGPRGSTIPILARSRIRYARKHGREPLVALERIGIGLGALTHSLFSRGGSGVRAAHLRALGAVLRRVEMRDAVGGARRSAAP
jgi:N-acetylglucosaminyl-diphospho-decaprenol L-rhamnosyltransferase